MKQLVEQLVNRGIERVAGADLEVGFDVSYPRADFGDYATNAAMMLAKKVPTLAPGGPMKLAEKLASEITNFDKEKVFESVQSAGGFINFKLSKKALLGNLQVIGEKADFYGKSQVGEGKTVVVEYFQNNVAKSPHVGHLRSAVNGDALARIFLNLGYKVVSDTHIGDWGTQFGILLLAFKTMGKKEEIETDPINKLNELYVSMSNIVKEKPEEYEKAKAEFKRLEDGDPENRGLWEWFVEESVKDFSNYCEILGLRQFDYNLGESFYEDKMPAVLEELESKGLVKSGESGERYVDLEESGVGRCILIKSDGATTYHMRDFATYIYRKKEWNFYKNLYVVDNRQSHHFKQLFRILELAGYPAESDSTHVDLGFMSLPTGVISTRGGNVVSLKALFEEAEKRSLEVINQKNPELADKEKISKQVATAAIKYFDLSHNRKTEIMFTWEKAISFEGNTGPYLQYTHARIHGILTKAAQELRDDREIEANNFVEEEIRLMRKLSSYPEIIELAAKECLPSTICTYLFELSQVFNTFYEAVPVMQETNILKKNFRLQLIKSTAQVIKNGLGLLGIEAPEEM